MFVRDLLHVGYVNGFLSHVSTLTCDIDIAFLSIRSSVCVSVVFRYSMETA